MKTTKFKLPGIGKRIMKSALAVALCVIIDLLRGDSGMVFYSQLAALWCIQMYRNNTLGNAIQRTIGTIIGALFGLIYLLSYPRITGYTGNSFIIDAFLLFIFIIMVLYTTVVINRKQASYFSCVVFLSIVINHIGDINPYAFVWNRFLDTMIGICIGIMVNNFKLCLRPNRKTLFVSGADNILLDDNDRVSAFSKVELNRMIEDGMRFTISTMRTPASLLEPLSDVKFRYPIIVMDGAALYDVKTNEYLKAYVISKETALELISIIKKSTLHPYINVIIDDTLLIYYQEYDDEVNRQLVERLKVSTYRNYIKREYPGNENVVYFMILDHTELVDSFYNELHRLEFDRKLKIIKYASKNKPGYSYLKIYNRNASKENMLLYLMEKYNIEDSMTFGTIPGKYDVLVHEDNFNEMVRLVRKEYEPAFWN